MKVKRKIDREEERKKSNNPQSQVTMVKKPPINECIDLICQKLEQDNSLPDCTKLNIDDICELLHLCLSTSQYIYNNTVYTAKDSGPIGLSLMVTISDIWMSFTIDEALKITRQKGFQTPSFLKKYGDDFIAKFRAQPPHGMKVIDNFLCCLNEVHLCIQFTVEYEEEEQIPFLDCLIRRLPNGRITTTIYRKPSDTNLTIKPNSCQPYNVILGTFKGFLCRAHRVCSTLELLQEEISNLLDIW